jgi:tetratricopeptide (TPR) repeat protein
MTRRAAAFTTAGVIAVLLAAAPWLRPLWRERRLHAAPRPLDVILITLDTTRADRLGCYGAGADVSPHLDALARRGVVFRRAYAHVPLTAPSHSSLLTGLLPSRHGVHDNGGYVLKDQFATLAEQFVEAGYRTGAFVSAFVLDRRFGLARGFATYEDDVGESPDRNVAEVKAEVTVGRALAWLRAPDARPSFAWVHLYDPHLPYAPPEPFATRFKARPYEGEIAYADDQVGRLLAAVATSGRPTLVAAVGDHGEGLGEHLELTHSYFIYEGTQHVPLILSLPGSLPEGAVVEPVVRAVDLMPTILEIAGLRVPDGIDGRSLAPLITGRSREEPGPAYLESYHPRLWWGARELLGLRTGRWLFIRSPRPELYDVDKDPGETVNVAAGHPEELERLGARLDAQKGAADPFQGRSATDPETAGRLRALGYVSGAAPTSAETGPEGLPDAKDNAPLLAFFSRAEDLNAKGDRTGALEAYRSALKINPRSVTVRLSVANTLLSLGRFTDALPEFGELSLQHPDEPAYVQGMARCLNGDHRSKEALDLLEPAVAKFKDAASLREDLAAALIASGRPQDAEKHLRVVVEAEPRQVAPRLRLAATLAQLGRLREAAAAFLNVVESSPRSEEGRKALAALGPLADRLLDRGDLLEAHQAYRAALRQEGMGDESIYLNLALVAYRLGRPGESMEVLEEGLAKRPGSPDLHYRLGRLYAEGGRRADAEREYRRTIELDGGRKDARLALGSLLEASGGRP